MLNAALLSDYMDTFYGYGDHAAPYWFIGIEEGGGSSCQEITNRLSAWSILGQRELEDVKAFNKQAGIGGLFGASAGIQSTWGRLIRVALKLEGRQINDSDILSYQKDELARPGKNTTLL